MVSPSYGLSKNVCTAVMIFLPFLPVVMSPTLFPNSYCLCALPLAMQRVKGLCRL